MSNLPNIINLEADTSGKNVEQKGDAFWEKITNHYHEYAPEGGILHNERSLPACWQIINKGVNKYVGILLAIVCSNSSGTNDEWNKTKTKFNLYHYFRILARHLKWKPSAPTKKKRRNSKVAASAPNPIGEGIDEEEFPACPAGRKFVKEQEATKRKWEKNIERLIALHSESIAKGDKAQDIKILLIDTSLIADSVSHQMMLDLKKKVQERGIGNTPISNDDSMSSNLFDISSKGDDCDGN
ncbi:hypothetical protein PHYBLDRAFT_141907 [Phycomyces blakesleeanus NRRL 1555(-)]|uniref:No apical meristem-associated C-terminal domain-containing protein n=1 Tax=Phycomyces blakesleeanus (strain ATCC 8743b / DSM 1359 / FGSC 10004 / NBRC 33097 / NRRL 1555) TaxID=763407 RepID=A0A167PJ16_PHYB8|nr:hypothetical protein PHYBLDRAFT_141907 [Phycomyces blakesleeanus NRRL 1555(-)]OAD78046.1 hypothetical protein PHYBLDRAFT_141907 [Phycomyces blakesleeanus NRRL 1555(-)]|eukprot:XP_018296086.1 hypothetical protein PHYBLDRAFT_141907 [Phycomyces blakesleeanus NRRL 1555(-)]